MGLNSSAEAPDRVDERRRAVALANHYRAVEHVSIAQIAERLGRSPTPQYALSTRRPLDRLSVVA
jgi:hypothetical protein